MNNINEAIDTKLIQEQSLVNFANAIGYEVVEDENRNIRRFKQPRFRSHGEEYISVKRMLRLHNNAAEDVFEYVKSLGSEEFSDFLNRKDGQGREMIDLMFAGSCKIVRKVKGQYTRKEGLVIQSNIVQFMTDGDYKTYGQGM